MTLLYLLLPVAYKLKFLTEATFKSTPMHTHTHAYTHMHVHTPAHPHFPVQPFSLQKPHAQPYIVTYESWQLSLLSHGTERAVSG